MNQKEINMTTWMIDDFYNIKNNKYHKQDLLIIYLK